MKRPALRRLIENLDGMAIDAEPAAEAPRKLVRRRGTLFFSLKDFPTESLSRMQSSASMRNMMNEGLPPLIMPKVHAEDELLAHELHQRQQRMEFTEKTRDHTGDEDLSIREHLKMADKEFKTSFHPLKPPKHVSGSPKPAQQLSTLNMKFFDSPMQAIRQRKEHEDSIVSVYANPDREGAYQMDVFDGEERIQMAIKELGHEGARNWHKVRKITDIQLDQMETFERIFTSFAPTGKASKQQFILIMQQVLLVPSPSQSKRLFRRLDTDRDGFVRWSEVVDDIYNRILSESITAQQVSQNYALKKPKQGTILNRGFMMGSICGCSDLKVVVTSDFGEGLFLWDVHTLARIGTILPPVLLRKQPFFHNGHAYDWVVSSTFNSFDRKLLLGCVDGSVMMYYIKSLLSPPVLAETRHLIHVPTCLQTEAQVKDIACCLLAGGVEGHCMIYGMEPWGLILNKKFHRKAVTKIAMLSDVGFMSSGLDGRLQLADLTHWDTVRSFDGHQGGVLTFCYSQHLHLAASGGEDSEMILWNPFQKQCVARLTQHMAPIIGIYVMEKFNHQLVSVSEDKMVKIWDVRKMKCIQTIKDDSRHFPEDKLITGMFDPYQQRLITCGSHMQAFNVQLNMEQFQEVACFSGSLVATIWSPFWGLVAVGVDGKVLIFDTWTGVIKHSFRVPCEVQLAKACIDPLNHNYLNILDQEGLLRVIELSTQRIRSKMDSHLQGSFIVMIHEKTVARRMIQCTADTIYLWKYPELTGQILSRRNMLVTHVIPSYTLSCMVSCMDDIVAVGTLDGHVFTYRLCSRSIICVTKLPLADRAGVAFVVENIGYLPQRDMLVVGSEDGTVILLRRSSLTEIQRYGAMDRIRAIAFDDQETLIVVGTESGYISIVNIDALTRDNDGYRHPRFEAHDSSINCIVAISSMPCFVTAAASGSMKLWGWDGEFVTYFYSKKDPGTWPIAKIREKCRQYQIPIPRDVQASYEDTIEREGNSRMHRTVATRLDRHRHRDLGSVSRSNSCAL